MDPHRNERTERGQVLVVFALSFLVLLGFAGLAMDGGSTFAQRRDQQTAADMAALAAANDYLINGSLLQAISRARAVTAANGYTHNSGGTYVDVSLDTSNGIAMTVDIDAQHRNTIVAALGMPTWEVSTTATSLTGFPDTAYGAAAFIFSAAAFNADGTPLYTTPTDFGEGNGDVPTSGLDIAWTNYGTGNVNTSGVRAIINGSTVIDKQLTYGEYIGQHNNGNHTALFSDVDQYLSGRDLPVPVVDTNGNFMGWSTFHVISASGGSSKTIRGYFLANFESARLGITSCAANDCPRYLGSYILKLTD